MNSLTNCEDQINSIELFDLTRKINIYLSFIVITIGLIVNSLAFVVFIQRRFRQHSFSIYQLCLSLSDGAFLIVHFYEDTLRTYIDVYLNNQTRQIDKECIYFKNLHLNNITIKNSIFRIINITDRFEFTCRLINYLRYFLRFFSAYIILVFTTQRAFAICLPFFASRVKSTKFAWFMIILLIIIGLLYNQWILFFFNVIKDTHDSSITYCDINKKFSDAYFSLTIFYVVITVFLPIFGIISSNTIIIGSILKANYTRNHLLKTQPFNVNISNKISLSMGCTESTFTKSFRSSINYREKINQNSKKSNRILKVLIMMSFSYVVLNLPYFISWCYFFYQVAIRKNPLPFLKYKLFSILNICEIFYVLNFAVNFFIYCASGKNFRCQLKQSFR